MVKQKTRSVNEVKATIEETTKGKLILHLSIDECDLEDLCLQSGVQPNGIFGTILIHKRK